MRVTRKGIGPNLRKSIVWTILLVVAFRLLALIPVFDVSESELNRILADNPLLGFIDLFSGGDVLTKFSVVGAGIFPLMLATLIIYVASFFVPKLSELREQGELGKQSLNKYANVLAIGLAFLIAWAVSAFLSREIGLFPDRMRWLTWSSFLPSLKIVFLFTSGSVLAGYVSSLITKYGVYDGKAILLVVGIVVNAVTAATNFILDRSMSDMDWRFLVVHAIAALIVLRVCYFLVTTEKRIKIQSARTAPSRRPTSTGQFIPFRYVYAGALPISAAIGVLAITRITYQFFGDYILGWDMPGQATLGVWLTTTSWYSWITFALLIVMFTYTVNFGLIKGGLWKGQLSLATLLNRNGTFIPGIRPGKRTDEYLTQFMHKRTPIGAAWLCLIAVVIPGTTYLLTGQDSIIVNLTLYVLVENLIAIYRRMYAAWTLEAISF